MILEITSDLEGFKNIKFRKGLNIIVANQHEKSTLKASRNGSGKTSIIEILHYLFQDKTDKKDDFHHSKMLGAEFSGLFRDMNGEQDNISRKSELKKDLARWNSELVSSKKLRSEFALKWFQLTEEGKYGPKFSPLFSYFVRRSRNHAFSDALKIDSHQQPWDSQVNLAYLLGFDWQLIQQLQNFKEEKKQLDVLSEALAHGLLGDFSVAEMQAEFDKIEGEVELKREQLKKIVVIDDYKSCESEANELTQEIRRRNEANLKDEQLISDIEADFEYTESLSSEDIRNIYSEVEFYFSDKVQKRFDQVEEFKDAIIHNRKYNLELERVQAKQRIEERRLEIQQKQIVLRQKMDILASGGALERYTALQSELNEFEAKLNDLGVRIPEIRGLESKREILNRKIQEQMSFIGQNVKERDGYRKFATQAFAEVSNYLYEKSGTLAFDRSRGVSGLSISLNIEAEKSQGKNKMQIFCFDWVLVQSSRKQGIFPGFLVHDSELFDGVDSRQVGLALQFADKKCKEIGAQYIVTMNSDDLEQAEAALGENVSFNSHIVLRLNDTEDGGLFGMRLG